MPEHVAPQTVTESDALAVAPELSVAVRVTGKVPATVGAPSDAAEAGTPTPPQPLESSTSTGPSTSGPTDGPTVVDPSDRHADDTEKVTDTSTGDQGENPGMQATPNPEAQDPEGSEPRDSNE